MSNYAKAAAGIYNPQQQAEQAEATRSRDSAVFELGQEEAKIDPSYTDAIKTQERLKSSDMARNDFTYSQALSGQRSGLLANTNRLTAEDYNSKIVGLDKERIEKKSAVAARRRMVGEQYSSILGGLAAKYAGLKSSWISDRQREDQAMAREERLMQRQRQWQLQDSANDRAFQQKMKQWEVNANKPDPAANAKAEALGSLDSAIASAAENKGKIDRFYREKVYQNLKTKYRGQLSDKDIHNLVYKQVFTDGWDKKYGFKRS